MINRRQFLVNTAILTSASALGLNTFKNAATKKKFGIQLYSFKDEIPIIGLNEVFKKIAHAGYNSVELCGYNNTNTYFNSSPKEISHLLKMNKLISESSHFLLNFFDNEWQQAIDAALTVGNEYIVVPWINVEYRKSADDYKAIAEKMNIAGMRCKKNNLRLAYHNHNTEFKKFNNGDCGYDIMLNETDKNLVDFEMDLFWMVRAGNNPIEYFKKHPGRFTMWHVKDSDKVNPDLNTEIGKGTLDFRSIFLNAELAGTKYFYVEQENFTIPTAESIKISIDYLKKLNGERK